MIELRWVMGHELVGADTERQVKVLQYRRFELGTDAGGALTVCGAPGWSPWVPVPTVTAEESEK